MPPTALFSTMPPNTSMPGTTFITSAARLAVSEMWFFSTMPRMPRALASVRHVDVVHVAAEDVRMRMHVHVDDAGGRTDFRRRRRESGLRERIIECQQGRCSQ